MAELREDRAVYEFDHRMHDALRVDDHFDAIHADVKKPARFDHFKRLVEQGGGVERDLAAHVPSGMAQGHFGSDLWQLGRRCFAEWPSRAGENETPHAFNIAALEALKNRAVLAIHRQHAHTLPAGRVHHNLAGHDQDFLARNRDVFSGFDGGKRGVEASGSYNRNEHQISLGHRREFHEAIDAIRPVGNGRPCLGKLAGGSGKPFRIGMRGHPDDSHPVGDITRDLEGALADGAGDSKNNDISHEL